MVIVIVNVIIPTYKGRNFLPNALDSLVAQTKKFFIVTISQDGDGENYDDIIEEYRRRGLHIRLVSNKENKGQGMARQLGMDADKMCDYFMFLDQDDLLMPRAVEVLYREAKRKDADIVHSDFISEDNCGIGEYLKSENISVVWCHNKIYKAKYLKDKNIRFSEEIRLNEDSYFNFVAVNCTKKNFRVAEPTYIWRANPNSITRTESKQEFFKKSWEQYVLSQILGIKKILDIVDNIETPTLALTLIFIYMQMMMALHFKHDIKFIKEKFTLLQEEDKVQEKINTREFWHYIIENLKPFIVFEKELIFFKENFQDWLNLNITKKI